MKQHSSKSGSQRSRTRSPFTRKSRLAVSKPGDRYEHEADKAADAVVAGRTPSFSFSRLPLQKTQREDKPEKPERSEDEAYNEAMKKLGEAFLETAPGKEIKEKAAEQGEAFISTLPGKVITGAAISGALASLAATEKALPVGLPEIPLDKIKPGLKLKLTYEGPVNKPTKVVATFSFKLGKDPSPSKKPAKTEAEKRREETVKLQKELYEFRQGMKTPAERAAEERAMYAYIASRMKVTGKPSPISFGAAGLQMGLPAGPSSSAQSPAKSPAGSGQFAPPDLKLTGESDSATKDVKKEEEGAVHRKSSSESDVGDAPPIVQSVLASSGRPLDPSTRVSMETRFGFDFSKVRIHTDSEATESARSVNAVAYTVGSDIVFSGGAFSPNTLAGQHLLAHELAHIVQQEGLPEADHSPLPRPANQLRRKKDAGTEPDPLARALKGDDDDVRDLTNHPSWRSVKLTSEQAAHLIIELLKGATFDDDEKAGLKILRKMLANDALDRTLEDLAAQDRLEQLLDDYNGAEYRQLLKLLSEGVENFKVKALLLDVFIAMWWLNTAEERAVVVILENTQDPNDRMDLLSWNNRLDEFRGDIDNHDLRLRFEETVGEAIGGRFNKVSLRLVSIFTLAGTEGVKRGVRTQEEVDHLFQEAVTDLAEELADYKEKIEEAVDEEDPGKVAEINKEFRRRLDQLVADKSVEYGIELKYNIEFNRLLNQTFGKKWSREDIKEIDTILQKIPYDILHANRQLEEFARANRKPTDKWVAGVAQEGQNRIQLRGPMSLQVTAHEIGHFIHYSDPKLFTDFQALSEWRYFERKDLPALVNDVKKRERLEKDLDKDYQKGQEDEEYDGEDFEVGDYTYRYSRYNDDPGNYVRRLRKAQFVTTYASTEPQDDFADSFGFMFANPRELQNKAPKKYEFMLVRVLTEYRLNRQKNRVLLKFDDLFTDQTMFGLEMAHEIRDKHVTPLRKTLEAALDRQRGAQVALARASVKAKPGPIPMGAEAEKLAEPHLEQARRLAKLTIPVVERYDKFQSKVNQIRLAGIDHALMDAFRHLTLELGNLIRDDLNKELDPLVTKVLKGEEVDKKQWPEIDAILKKALKSVSVVTPYLPRYADSLIQNTILFNNAIRILKSLPKNARFERIRVKINAFDTAFNADLRKWRADVLDLVRAGKPFDKRKVKRPFEMRVDYDTKMKKAVRETR